MLEQHQDSLLAVELPISFYNFLSEFTSSARYKL